MKNFMVMLLMTALFFLTAASAAVGETSVKSGDKTPLWFSLIPKKDVDQQISDLKPLLGLLEEKLQRPIKIMRPQSYHAVIEGILSQSIDFAILGPASYAKARARDSRVDAFASFAAKKGFLTPQGSFYNSVLFTLKPFGYTSLMDLKRKKVAFTDPESTSGFIIPNMEFSRQMGLSLKAFFGTQIYTGSHDRSINAVANGHVDAAFVSSARVDEAVKKKKITADDIVILWRSRPIHYDPFVFGGSVQEPLRQQIKQILLSSSPQLDPMLKKMTMAGLVAVSNRDYQAIHDIVAAQSNQEQ
jgi:phosphonate transport system substrate-binding protein